MYNFFFTTQIRRAVIKTVSIILFITIPLPAIILPNTIASAQSPIQLPTGFAYQAIAKNLEQPTNFALAPDGRIFITQKSGEVKVIHNGTLQRRNFINLRSQINQYADRGLTSVAVHPNFPETPYLYFAYVYEPPEAANYPSSGGRVARVLRVSANPDNLNIHQPGSETVLLGKNSTFQAIGNPSQPDQAPFSCINKDNSFIQNCLPAEGSIHVISHLLFARDGSLLVSTGSGTINPNAAMRAQDIDSLAGKILRINSNTGQGYPNNPFFDGNPSSNRSKVYALGLRSGFRIGQNPQTGKLIVAETGYDTWETVSIGGAGANFGWPCYEGPNQTVGDPACNFLFNGSVPVIPPAYYYRHQGGIGAIIGGTLYNSSQFPTEYQNVYFFSDYATATIRYLTFSPSGSAALNTFATNAPKIIQTQADADGTLYLLSISRGELGQIRYQSSRSANQSASTTTAASNPEERTRSLKVVIQRIAPATPISQGRAADPALKPAQPVNSPAQRANSPAQRANNQTQQSNPVPAPSISNAGQIVDRLPALPQNIAPTPQPAISQASQQPAANTGTILREWWIDIEGKQVADLVNNRAFPSRPSGSELISQLEAPSSFGEEYGTRIRGYLHPPSTGNYSFWIASDDSSQLWLSTDSDPDNKVMLALVTHWTPKYKWAQHPEQASAPIMLQAGSKYYIEVLHKEAAQKDNLAVAWQPPGGNIEVIDGRYLSPP